MRSPRTATKGSPHSPQLEKAHASNEDPKAAINQSINQSIKQKNTSKQTDKIKSVRLWLLIVPP